MRDIAFQGGPPVREVPTDALGEVRTVWVGDFTVAENSISSCPFDVGPGVFDSAVRAAQRAFYYQRASTDIDARYAQGPWVHASDAALAPPGVVKGWHDAGDFSTYQGRGQRVGAQKDIGPRGATPLMRVPEFEKERLALLESGRLD
jgi:hypothetical protein